ncbi:MAG: PAS domain S-box protein [Candidatus Heimdallarchaeota archaeon]|nr:PAS domain S-box protein [Candidatus Heimdallarchaeota archaeon]
MDEKLQILHLEDNPIDAELIKETLSYGGINCEVVPVHTREGFLTALDEKEFDLILADYSLPSFDGLAALEIVRKRGMELPFIFISAVLGEELAVETLKRGATDYVIKSRLERLVPAVERALREKEARIYRRELEREIMELEQETKELEATYQEVSKRVRGFLKMELPSGKLTLVDKFLAELSGYPIKEWHETPNFIQKIVRPDFQEYYREKFKQMQDGIVPKMMEYAIIRQNGEERWWHQFNIGAFNVEGELVSISSVIIDDTENKESEIKYQNLFENALVGIFRTDFKTGKIIEANEKLAKMYGYSSISSFKHSNILNHYLNLRDREKVISQLQQNIVIEELQIKQKRKDGSFFWISLSARYYPKEGFIEGIVIDITDKKKAEEELYQREQELEKIFENTGTATIIVEEDKTISKCNQQFEIVTGYSKEEIEGKMFWDQIVHPEDRTRMVRYHYTRRTKAAATVPAAYEHRIIDKYGTIKHIYLRVAVLPGTDKSVAAAMDITDRIKAEERIERERKVFQIIAEAAVFSVDIPDLCQHILTGLIEILDFDIGSIRLFEEKNELLHPIAAIGLEEAKGEAVTSLPLKDQQYLVTLAARTKKPIFAPDITNYEMPNDVLPKLEKVGIRAIITWPIVSRDKELLGTIQLAAYQPKKIPEDDQIFFETIAGMFSTALERKRAEEALRASEEKYRTLYETALVGLYRISQDTGELLSINNTAAQLFRYDSQREALEQFRAGNHLTREQIEKIGVKLEQKGFLENYEIILKRKDNSEFWARISAKEYPKEGHIEGTIIDITEQKELEIHQRQLSNIVANSKEVVISADENGTILYANPAVEDVFGWKPEELEGKNISLLAPPAGEKLQQRLLEEALQSNKLTVENVRKHKDGTLIPVIMTLTPLVNEQTETTTLNIMIVDMSKVKKLEDSLRSRSYDFEVLNKIISVGNSAQSLDELLDFSLNAVLSSLDFEGGAIYLIDESEQVAEIKRVLGMPRRFVDSAESIPVNHEQVKQLFVNGQLLISEEFWQSNKEGEELEQPTKSLIAVPFFSKQQVIGALVLTIQTSQQISKEDKEMLKAIGREIGNAIGKMLLEEELIAVRKSLQKMFEKREDSL